MISVKIDLDASKRIIGFSVLGHADFAEFGRDIVCAAVSAVTQTAVIGLQHILGERVEVVQKSGNLSCYLPVEMSQKEIEAAGAILDTMRWGLEAIETEHQTCLKMALRGCK